MLDIQNRSAAVNQDANRAAAYVRKSTDLQEHSTRVQSDAIHQYAQRHGFEVVRTYADDAKSGLHIDGRYALQQLIRDVQSRQADFRIILVYDVSRWGRFQDSDESAYYEYICKRAGIRVIYCAEQFDNDNSPLSAIIKNIKRAMAAEYSRELSAKVFAGQSRIVKAGYHMGQAGFGLRRKLIDASGKSKMILAPGERKSIQNDRVILVPGPPREVAIVRWIYSAYLAGKFFVQIADELNARKIETHRGDVWTRHLVFGVLTNENYIGNNVWNRFSCKLKSKPIKNPRNMWIRVDGAFKPLIDRRTFDAVQAAIKQRSSPYTEEELLSGLGALYKKHGYLSAALIDRTAGIASINVYVEHFGSLGQAYERVGFTPYPQSRSLDTNRRLRAEQARLLDQIGAISREIPASTCIDYRTKTLTINDELTLSVVIARYCPTAGRKDRWMLRGHRGCRTDIMVIARMDHSNHAPMDYFVIPKSCTEIGDKLTKHNVAGIDAFRSDTLDPLFRLLARTTLGTGK